jgi:phage gpG-like protein
VITFEPGKSPADAVKALKEMALRARDLRPVLVPGAEALGQMLTLGFERSTAPDGTAWAPNAQSTIDRKRGSSKPNIDTTRLKRSVYAKPSGMNGIALGTNVPYGGPAQFGSTRTGTLAHASYSARTVAGRTKSGKKSKARGKRVSLVGPTFKREAGTPWKVTIPARPFLPFTAAGALTSTGPIAALIERLRQRVYDYISTGKIT